MVFRLKAQLDVAKVVPKSICHSSDQAFLALLGPNFGRLRTCKPHQKMKSVSDVFLGSNFDPVLKILGPNSSHAKMRL